MDIPVEILLDIFEQLKFNDLISLAKIHPQTRDVVEILMKQEIANKSFTVRNDLKSGFSIQYEDNQIPFDFSSILFFFRNFGHHITQLVITERFGNLEQQKLSKRYIMRYSADYLKEIDFSFEYDSYKNALMSFEGSFSKAKRIRLQKGSIQDISSFSEQFPVVESLDVRTMSLRPGNWNGFLHLNRLTMPESSLVRD